ncbi:MAG: VanZ family protein [Planctomycetota bacterium]|jgi:hypothetical protein
MLLVRTVCVAYLGVLTFLLLTPDPFALIGLRLPPGPSGGITIHFLSFAILSLLVCASRWPVRRGVLAGALLCYAILTETLQATIPNREVQLLDYLENLLGLVAGIGIWWAWNKCHPHKSVGV